MATDIQYFQDIFETSDPLEIDQALAHVKCSITESMNDELTRPVTESEVKLALFSMHPEKASRPDGMIGLFYQKFWNIVKEEVICMVNNFLIECTIVPGLSETKICLNPKKEKPQEISQFRPISLCNVAYKIISKLLCQRLKKALSNLILET